MKQSHETDSLDEHGQTDQDQSQRDIEGNHSSLLGAEIDPEVLFEQWSKEDAWAKEQFVHDDEERFSVGRHPLILIVVIIVSAILALYTFPALEAVIYDGKFEECGDVLERGLKKAKGDQIIPFYHQQTCRLSAMVGTPNLFAIGAQENPDSKDEFERNRGVSYVVKLNGDQVYAILPAHPRAIEGYRLKNGSLFGLEFIEIGLMINPNIAKSYRHLEKELRLNLGISPQETLWFFDVTYSPWDHKMPLITSILTPLICLLTIMALWREMKRRRRETDEDQSEERWLAAFEAAALEAGLESDSNLDEEQDET